LHVLIKAGQKSGKEKGSKKGKKWKKAAAAAQSAATHPNNHEPQPTVSAKSSLHQIKSKSKQSVPNLQTPEILVTDELQQVSQRSIQRVHLVDEGIQASRTASNLNELIQSSEMKIKNLGDVDQQQRPKLDSMPLPELNQRRKCSTFIDKPFTLPLVLTIKHSASPLHTTISLEPIMHLVDMLENPSTRLSVTSTNIRRLSLASAERSTQGLQSQSSVSIPMSTAMSVFDDGEEHFGDDATQTGPSTWNLEHLEGDEEAEGMAKKKRDPGCLPQELALPLCLTVRVSGMSRYCIKAKRFKYTVFYQEHEFQNSRSYLSTLPSCYPA